MLFSLTNLYGCHRIEKHLRGFRINNLPAVKSFAELNQAVEAFVFVPTAGSIYTLDRIKKLLAKLDNPQEKFKTIHVAGTSGKTSTSYYLANILQASGYKVGLTVSPHIQAINERVQINLIPVSEKEFCRQFNEFSLILNTLSIRLTYFELFVAFAFWYFAKTEVDYAVVEVGLGGTLDATNVIERTDKICAITDIGLDHTEVLGNDLAAVAQQKAGIIGGSNNVFMNSQDDKIMRVIKAQISEQQAKLTIVDGPTQDFQQRNWQLAKTVCEYIFKMDNGRKLTENQWQQTAKMTIPGRLEVVEYSGKTLVFDGAHNSQKMTALVKAYQWQFTGKTTTVLLAVTDTKNNHLEVMAKQLQPIADHLIISSFSLSQDVAKESLSPYEVAKYFDSAEVEPDLKQALTALLGRKEEVLLITGSLYLISVVKKLMKPKSRLFSYL